MAIIHRKWYGVRYEELKVGTQLISNYNDLGKRQKFTVLSLEIPNYGMSVGKMINESGDIVDMYAADLRGLSIYEI